MRSQSGPKDYLSDQSNLYDDTANFYGEEDRWPIAKATRPNGFDFPLHVASGDARHVAQAGDVEQPAGPDELSAQAVAIVASSNAPTAVTALGVNVARTNYTAATGGTLTGAGLKIGILSNSFNYYGGEASDISAGLLPPASQITIVKDGNGGASDARDEGRAMAQLIYQIAPGAQIYFYTATDSESDFATGINTLVGDGVNVIVDDVAYSDEPFYQDTGLITQAAEAAVAAGVSYFTAAGNNSNNYYEANFTTNPALTMSLPGIAGRPTLVNNAGNGSPYEAISINQNSMSAAVLDFSLQWDQPFGANTYDLGVALYAKSGSSYSLIENYTVNTIGGNPVLAEDVTLPGLAAGIYYMVIYESKGAPVTPDEFKLIFFEDSTALFLSSDNNAGIGSGATLGHQDATGVNTVAAVNVGTTPATDNGAQPTVEPFSSNGPGETYINASGVTSPSPVSDAKPSFAGVDGEATSVFSTFSGTSAAAPTAAAIALLMLQADPRLTPAQVTYLLEQSALPTGSTITGGAGLVQASGSVGASTTAAGAPTWTGQGGDTSWANAANWSDAISPRAADPVTLTNGLGLFTASYAVGYDQASTQVASLDVDGGLGTGALPNLQVQAGEILTAGSLTLGAGAVDVAGVLMDLGALIGGSALGVITIEGTGTVSIAGGTGSARVSYTGSGGDLVFTTANNATLLSGLTAAITNFSVGDVLDLRAIATSTVAAVMLNGTTATLVNDAAQALASVIVSGNFSQLGFAPDGSGGTALLACYLTGTHIATPDGERRIEMLRVGDHVTTASGGMRPIRWLGRRGYAERFVAANPHLTPIRFRAGSLGGGIPHRDLLVSAEHAMLIAGQLVPARLLVDGRGVVRDTSQGAVMYYHIELETHDAIIAEGASSETFLDDGTRGMFHNAHEYGELYPDAPDRPLRFCAPRLVDGYALDRIRLGLRRA